jgi:phosphoenolpyruvate-protein kinase (PTS system EI component)
MRVRLFPAVICIATFFSITSFAQTSERPQTKSVTQAQERAPNLPSNANSVDTVANEIGLLRKSLQTLNTRLREINDKFSAPDFKQSDQSNDKQNRISLNLELLSRAEQRAEVMRKQLLELIEKEASFKNRLMQVEEDMRPDSVERSISLIGSTRTSDLRDVRRRVLENERKGVESLLNQTSQSRARLEDDVKQADALVLKLRLRILPLIDKEIERINPN